MPGAGGLGRAAAAILLLALGQGAVGAPAPPAPTPGAGTLLQELQPLAPPAPSGDDSGLHVESPAVGAVPASVPFRVATIQLSGNVSFATAALHELVADTEGHDLTLAELTAAVDRITAFYRARGYPLARAVIPPQTIRDGVVLVEVVEARYGSIAIRNDSRTRTPLLEAALAPLKSGDPIFQPPLDRALLLLVDTPGVAVDAALKAGERAGTSDLTVTATRGPRVAGNAYADNNGARYTGRARMGGELDFLGPLGFGDTLGISGLSSGRDLQYGRLSYDTLVSGAGTHVGASYSELHYVLGANLAALGGHGTAEVGSAWLRQVVERGTTLDVYAQLQFDHKRLQDDLDASEIHNDRHLNNWSASIAGDRRDGAIAGGVSTWSLGVTSGQLGFDNTRAAGADAYSARTAGRFLQGDATLARLQGLAPRDAIYIALSGQWSNVNLDPSQKLTAGGAQTVRSYDTNSATGDAALQATGEWRHDLAAAFHGRWQTTAFVDLERLRLNRSVWTAGPNNATLGGVGAALSWSGAQQWSAKGSIAVRVGAPPPIVGDASETRAWLEVNKRF